MARYDKYEPIAGGFRAPLAANFLDADLGVALGVGLNANGQVVKGAGTVGVVGVLVLTKALKAGDIVDVMTDGEILEFGGTPGTVYNSAATGVITAGAAGATPAGSTRVGHTVEGNRLVVRFRGGAAA